MKKLYIIGNGFDLYHGLPSRYTNFHSYVAENKPELLDQLDSYFDFQVDEKYLWTNFEQDLCSFDHEGFMDNFNHIDVMSESFKLSDFYGLEDEVIEESENLVEMIRGAFVSWVESFNFQEPLDSLYDPLNLDKDDWFINFNYTDTLEELYNIQKRQILYIHNNANAYDGELIFGHGQLKDHADVPTFDEDGEPTRTMLTDSQNASRAPFYAFQKDTKTVLKQHLNWFKALKNIEEVVVLGHSIGNVDWPYFRKIAKQAPLAHWKLSYYGKHELSELQKRAAAMLHRSAIQMITFREL